MIRSLMGSISNLANKVTSILYVYCILVIIVFVYPTMIGNETQEDRQYIPKRQKGIAHRAKLKVIREIIPNIVNRIVNWSEQLKVNRTLRLRRKVARNMQCNTLSRDKGRIGRYIVMSVLAMATGDKPGPNQVGQRVSRFDTDSESIGIDNRCSACISHRIEDFIDNPQESNRTIKGFGGTRIENVMRGTLKWRWYDDEGRDHSFIIPNSYYVPTGSVRLLSPQHWAQTQIKSKKDGYEGIGCDTKGREVVLYWNGKQNSLTVPISRANNVATLYMAAGYNKFKLFCEQAEINYDNEMKSPLICMPADMDKQDIIDEGPEVGEGRKLNWPSQERSKENTFNLDGMTKRMEIEKNDLAKMERESTEAEFLEIHQRYGHISFFRLREMAKQGIIGKKFAKCNIPMCSTCLFAKASRKKWRDRPTTRVNRGPEIKPGDVVSVDQLVSPTPGLVAQMTGKLTKKRYKYVTVFVDQSSRLGFIHLQASADADETIMAKRAFEEYARQNGIYHISGYHADNGVFRANKWIESCRRQKQSLSFAGVNAHHQNGIAERRIKEIQELSRSMMIHANRRWPEAITPNLWPYAIRMANEVINDTPSLQDPERRSPIQIFSGSKVNHNTKHQQTFGCPAYVLDNTLQQKGIFHKWNQRARVGIYLGKSPQHAKNVSLILDRMSGLVSPQFHVRHDNRFDTLKQERYESQWQIKAGFVSERTKRTRNSILEDTHQSLKEKTMENITREKRMRTEEREKSNAEREERLKRRNERRNEFIMGNSEGVPRRRNPEGAPQTTHPEGDNSPIVNEHITDESDIREIFSFEALFPNETPEIMDPLLAYKAVADPDVMYLHQAMKEHDRDKFIEAMRKEIRDQSDNGNFSIMRRDKLPPDKRVLKTVWQMRRKRDIKSRIVKKYKARLNVDGSRMIRGVDYDETYSPVATWRTIRLLMTLSALNGWHTRQLDYVLAFPQAPVERELYMEIPKGFDIDEGRTDDYILKINRNIYGQKQAGRVWNQYLVNKLIKELGFRQSKVDECLFYRGNIIYVLYTDDSILAGPDRNEIDKLIVKMREIGLNITDEGNIEDFLGVNIDKKENGEIHLTQPHLIDQVIKDLRLEDEKVKIKETPAASSKILSEDPMSEPFDDSFHYRSVIGKLNYLEKSTRPDISYAAHQCARFTETPRKSHGQAVRWIARYLKGTRDKGIIMKPMESKELEMYVDADFAGNWKQCESSNRDNARSRHGYIISYKNCPILWKSQLQGEIALSSTESEYVGISYGLRDVIPIMECLKEMQQWGVKINDVRSTILCRVFEDNSGALEMAAVHKYRPRTKHINVKYHHFRDYVTRGEVLIKPINTKQQPADILTKPVPVDTLNRLRPYIMGW